MKGKEKGITITNTFQDTLDELGCIASKIWAGRGSNFYKKSLKSLLQDNDIEMYSTHKGKSVVPDRFIRTLEKNLKFTNV